MAGLIFYAFATDSVRLDIQSDTPDSYKLFEYQAPSLDPVIEVRKPFEPFSSIRFPVRSKLSHLRLDLGEHTPLLRIRKLCFEQALLTRRCFDGSQLVPHVQLAHDISLTADGPDLIVLAKSNHPYLAFQPSLAGYPLARLTISLALALGVYLLFTFPGGVGWVACAALLLWCGSNLSELFRLTRQTYTPAPIWDYWRIIEYLQSYRHFDVSVFWIQHNEHRIVFPEIFMAADAILLKCRFFLPLALAFFFQLSTIALYSFIVCRDAKLSLKLRCFTIILGIGLVAWPGMAVFLSRPFLFAWLFTQFGVVLALAALPRRYLSLAIAGGVIATYSTANGMVVWPVLILAAFALRFKARQILILAGSGVLSTALYFVGYHPTKLHPELLLQEPLNALAWIAAYLSLPFGFSGAQAGFLNGFAGLVLLAAAIAFTRLRSPASVVFQGAALFVVASAVTAASGRMMPGHITPSTDFDMRFLSLPLFFWVSLLFALTQFKWNWLIAGIAAALVALQFVALSPWMERQLLSPQKTRLAALAAECGTLDEALIGGVLERELTPVEQWLPILRRNGLSMFSSRRFEWLGKPAPFAIDPQPAQGGILTSVPVAGGLEITGWTTGKNASIVFLNEKGAVLGFGESFGPGWTGLANLEMSGRSMRAYRLEDGRLAAIGASTALPDAIPVSVQRMGQRIAGIEWKMDPAWSESAIAPDVADAPFGVHLGTFRLKHAAGKVESAPFSAPPGNCIVVPAGHSGSVAGQTIQIVDSERQTTVATIPIGPIDGAHWRLWRVPLPPDLRFLKIVAEDRATGEREWLGLGEPARCTSSYE